MFFIVIISKVKLADTGILDMSLSLHDFLKKEVTKMICSMSRGEKGNIHPLIMNEIEKNIIKLVLEETRGNYLQAARVLGISRSTLYRRVLALGLSCDKNGDK